jgi:hypothetical protein
MNAPETITIKVHMLANQPEYAVREVVIDSKYADSRYLTLLEAVFVHGQNDFQNVPGVCSVSIGDIIELDASLGYGKYHLVAPLGFSYVSDKEFRTYLAADQSNRRLWSRSSRIAIGEID